MLAFWPMNTTSGASRSSSRLSARLRIMIASAAALGTGAASADLIAPEFASDYVLVDLGTVSTVPTNYGGVMFDPADPNTLWIGGNANHVTSALYAVPLVRDGEGHIVGFGPDAPRQICTTPGDFGGIDGGVDVHNGVILYVTYSDNRLGQVKPGSDSPDRLIDLATLGIASSTGTLRIVPPGFPGAGRLKIVSYTASWWYDATMSMALDGTVDVAVNPTPIDIGGGPEGIIYVAAGNPGFTAPSILVSRYVAGQVVAYEVDSNGDPIVGTMRLVIEQLSGAEGAVVDPLTGDFLFSTFGSFPRLLVMRGFTQTAPCPADLSRDGKVDGADLTELLGNWGQPGASDLDGSGTTDGGDITAVLGAWGDCP